MRAANRSPTGIAAIKLSAVVRSRGWSCLICGPVRVLSGIPVPEIRVVPASPKSAMLRRGIRVTLHPWGGDKGTRYLSPRTAAIGTQTLWVKTRGPGTGDEQEVHQPFSSCNRPPHFNFRNPAVQKMAVIWPVLKLAALIGRNFRVPST
jgi:hypothetical protein